MVFRAVIVGSSFASGRRSRHAHSYYHWTKTVPVILNESSNLACRACAVSSVVVCGRASIHFSNRIANPQR